ncbi:siroheme synthase CysG [Jannaschia sp. CCS1]|uniref:siroheme synthase CysG n=1 Tax=Jannaschia sp. (strain CCS1) TaxID=290400 RepID=UPI000053BDBE|nr:siroheme synthase CysG [Jannaschia sp. CCS1]ABD55964.1 uroporphyrin-III C-methyltransferase [Jannaschia sp. CCS1]
MKSFPMFFRTSGRRVVIVGGGEQAAQKARLILKTDAQIVLAAPELDPELEGIVASGRAMHQMGPVTDTTFTGAAMAFIATGCPGWDASVHALAQAARCPVNVVDRPDLCDITTPSIVDRDPVVVAIGTEGTAPVLGREIKTRVEQMLPVNIGGLAELAGRLRPAVTAQVPRAKRRAFWAWVFKSTPRTTWTRGAERDGARMIKEAIAQGGAPDTQTKGSIALVGAGPGARDLLTLRAVERLQEADVIFYDRLVDPDVLELARRDAERVFVGKHVGAHAWPQAQINGMIVAEALKGRRVVRLKSGDPGIFGRAGEEIEAAETADIPIEVVPGITAASAASAAMGQSLTTRGRTDTLVLATGTGNPDAPLPDCVRFAGPGTTTAIYMGVRHVDRICAALQARGFPANAMIDVCVDVEKCTQRLLSEHVATLPIRLKAAKIEGCALLLVKWPLVEQANVAPEPILIDAMG